MLALYCFFAFICITLLYMEYWANIFAVLFSLVLGAYGIILLYQLRNSYRIEYLNSLFFFQIFIVAFGIYGLLGSALVRNILLKYEVNIVGLESVAQIVPYLGMPFMIAAWFLLIKASAELMDKKLHQFIAIGYFMLFTAAFLLYGYFLKSLTDAEELDASSLNRSIRQAFYLCELAVVLYILVFIAFGTASIKQKRRLILVVRFAIILLLWVALKSVALHFASVHLYIRLYYMLLFFAGSLPLILLLKTYLQKHAVPQTSDQAKTNDTALIERFGITPREHEIILEICKGKTNKQIADDLFISLQTVKDHTHNIYKRSA
jgi:hypothetical protein